MGVGVRVAAGDVMKWLVSWRVAGVEWSEEFVYRYNALQWVHVIRRIWGVEAIVQEVVNVEA